MATLKRILEFHSAGFAQTPIAISVAHGVEGISLPWRWDLEISYPASESPAIADILKKPAWLGIKMPAAGGTGTVMTKFHGVISSIEVIGRRHDHKVCRVVFESLLSRLSLWRKTRMFTKTNVKDILTAVLKEGGFSDDLLDLTRLKQSYSEQESLSQEHETNFDFCSRLMERYGIYSYSQLQDSDKTILALGDDWSLFPVETQEIQCRAEGASFQLVDESDWLEGITSLRYRTQVIPDQVVVTDYNWRKTEMLRAHYPASPAGERIVHIPGEHFKTKKEGEYIAQLRFEGLQGEQTRISGESNVRRLRAGTFVTLKDPFYPEVEKIRILEITHEIRQASESTTGGEGGTSYRNTFLANLADAPYRPPQRTPKPTLTPRYGFIDVGDQYSGLNEGGLYPVRDPNHEDQSKKDKGQASRLFRRVQPNVGPNNSGDHRPLHNGTEVLLIPLDTDRWVIGGALFNSKFGDVCTGGNAWQSIRRSAGGIQEIMDDTDGSQYYSLFCPTNNDHISLGADHHSEHAPPGVAIGSKSGITINAGGGVQVTAGSPNHDNGVATQSNEASSVHSTAALVAAVAALACGIAADAAAGGVGAIAGVAGDVGGFIGGLALPGAYITAPGKASLIGKAEAVVGSLGSADVIALGPANILSVTSALVAGGLAAAVISGLNVEAVSVAGNVKIHAKLRNVYIDAMKDIKLESQMGNIILETKLNDIKLEATGAFHLETFTDRGVIHIWKDLEIASKNAKKIRLVAGESEITIEDKKIQLRSDTIELVTNDKKCQVLIGAEGKDFLFSVDSKEAARILSKKKMHLLSDTETTLQGKSKIHVKASRLEEQKPSKIVRANSEEG